MISAFILFEDEIIYGIYIFNVIYDYEKQVILRSVII
jgi:hypothetical protein